VRLHVESINRELARLGHDAVIAKAKGYFYFHSGETVDWIDRSVPVRTINSLTLKQWIAEFRRLKALNEQILSTVQKPRG